jgi:hypothetical protein
MTAYEKDVEFTNNSNLEASKKWMEDVGKERKRVAAAVLEKAVRFYHAPDDPSVDVPGFGRTKPISKEGGRPLLILISLASTLKAATDKPRSRKMNKLDLVRQQKID